MNPMSYNTHTEKLGRRDVMKRILLIMRILSTICNFRMIKNAFVNKRVLPYRTTTNYSVYINKLYVVHITNCRNVSAHVLKIVCRRVTHQWTVTSVSMTTARTPWQWTRDDTEWLLGWRKARRVSWQSWIRCPVFMLVFVKGRSLIGTLRNVNLLLTYYAYNSVIESWITGINIS